MYPQKIVSLFTCCSLVLGVFMPLQSLPISGKSASQPGPSWMLVEAGAADLAASDQSTTTLVSERFPDSPQVICGSILYGQTVTGSIAPYGEDQCYTFYGQAGDEVTAQLISPIDAEFTLELKWPDGSTMYCFSWGYEPCLIEAGILLTTGTYTLTVGASSYYSGEYSLTLGSAGSEPITLGESRTVQVNVPLSFRVNVPYNTSDLFITLQKFSTWTSRIDLYLGNQLLRSAEHWIDQIIHLPSPTAGTYELKIYGSGEARLSVLAALPDLPLGQWVTGTIYNEYGLAWYQSQIPSGQDSVYFYAEALGVISQLDVYQTTFGTTPYWSDYGTNMEIEIPSPSAGTYYLQLSDSALVIGDSQERDHMIRADVVPIDPPVCSRPFISSFTPAQGGTSMPVTVHLSGQCLDQATSVCLTGVDPNGVCAQEVSPEDDGRSLSATFDLSSAAPGDWSLQVSTSKAQTAVAPELFTVRSGGETDLWVEITGREQFRLGRTQTYHVSYGNKGLVDAYDVLLHVKVPGSAEVSVDLPHPPDDSIDWDSISSIVDMGTEKVIPVWLLRMGAGSRDGFDFAVTITDGQIGDQVTITAELREVNSTFALTGDLDDIEDSPVFISLVESVLLMLDTYGSPTTNGYPSLSKAGAATATFGEVAEELLDDIRTFWDHLGPKAAVVGAGLGLVAGLLCGGPLLGLIIGISLGSAVDSVLFGFQLHQLITIPVFRKLAELFGVDMIDSLSPEDKYGPSGYDPPGTSTTNLQRWIPADRAMDYRIDFWNKEDAPAATVDVIITDTLDTDLDWTTFYFTGIGFLDWQVELQPTQYFNVDVAGVSIDLSAYFPGEPVVDMIVNVEGTYDATSGFIEWHFHALDPVTRQPPENPYAGFLPPITDSGWEIGWVGFSVDQKDTLSSGTVIQNQAFVKFDQNKYNPAPKEGPTTNTVDVSAPESAAQLSSTSQLCSGVLVTWTGQDDQNGSGVGSVDLYVDDLSDANPPYLWLGSVQSGWAMFTGTPGHSYGFYTRARDNVGNLEPAPDPLSFDAQAAVGGYCLFAPMEMLNY